MRLESTVVACCTANNLVLGSKKQPGGTGEVRKKAVGVSYVWTKEESWVKFTDLTKIAAPKQGTRGRMCYEI